MSAVVHKSIRGMNHLVGGKQISFSYFKIAFPRLKHYISHNSATSAPRSKDPVLKRQSTTSKHTMTTPQSVKVAGFAGLLLGGDYYPPRNANLPPVCIWPGGGQTKHSWGELCSQLSERGHAVLNMDLRGHGDSEWSSKQYYKAWMFGEDTLLCADYVKKLMLKQYGVSQKPIVVGASMGGLAAIFACGSPRGQEAIGGLILVDIAARLEVQGVERIVNFMTAFPNGFESVDAAADAVSHYMGKARPTDVSGLEKNLRYDSSIHRWKWHWDPSFLNHGINNASKVVQFGNSNTEFESDDARLNNVDYRDDSLESREARLEEMARCIRCPTLIIRGKSSDVLSYDGIKHFLDLVPHAEWKDIQNAEHMVAGDQNDVFVDTVLHWLSQKSKL
jgi:pimeloyl-ACP methyl ester carboxylesterase